MSDLEDLRTRQEVVLQDVKDAEREYIGDDLFVNIQDGRLYIDQGVDYLCCIDMDRPTARRLVTFINKHMPRIPEDSGLRQLGFDLDE